MKIRFYSILASGAFLLAACTQLNSDQLKEVKKVQEAVKDNTAETSQFIQAPSVEITEPAAVYFHPDSIKLTKLEESLGDKFFTEADESMFDISTSREYLTKQKVKIIETEAKELRFKKSDGSVKVIDLNNPKYSWGLFLFNGEADPKQADMKKPEKDFQAYMNP